MDIKTQRYLSLGLAALNVAGTIGMFVSLTKEAPKAQVQLNSLPKDAKKSTKAKTFIKNYKVSLIFAGATIASGVASKVLSTKTEASLIATVGMLDASLRKYKGKIKETLGIKEDKDIVREIIKDNYSKSDDEPEPGEQLFKCDLIGYFYAKPENIWKHAARDAQFIDEKWFQRKYSNHLFGYYPHLRVFYKELHQLTLQKRKKNSLVKKCVSF